MNLQEKKINNAQNNFTKQLTSKNLMAEIKLTIRIKTKIRKITCVYKILYQDTHC